MNDTKPEVVTMCGVDDGHFLCSFSSGHQGGHSWEAKSKDRPGDQPPPVPNDGPSMHDLVCADLEARWTARLSPRIVADLQARKQLGLERYKSLLQAHNGRDALLDLYEELEDAACYARQVQEESGGQRGSQGIGLVYDELLTLLICVRRLRDERP